VSRLRLQEEEDVLHVLKQKNKSQVENLVHGRICQSLGRTKFQLIHSGNDNSSSWNNTYRCYHVIVTIQYLILIVTEWKGVAIPVLQMRKLRFRKVE
jgi:hypothetical protein